jgi:hypothetical protein
VSTAVACEVTLLRSVVLSGHIADHSNAEPIAGALLSFRHADCAGCAPERAVSGAAGAYRFAAFPVGRRVELQVEAAGYVSLLAELEVGPQAPGAERDLVLSRGLPLAVTVIDAHTRAPLEGASVSGARGPFPTDGAGRLLSDQLVAPGSGRDARAKLELAAPGYCHLTLSPSLAELSRRAELLVPMMRSATVVGRVVDGRGEPAGPVALTWDGAFRWESKGRHFPPGLSALAGLPPWTLTRERTGTEPSFRSGADGRFVLQGAVPWAPALELRALADDGTRGAATLGAPGPGETSAVVIELRSGAPSPTTALIAGRVTLNGVPEPGRVLWQGATRRGSAPADEHGRFELVVEPGTVELRVQGEQSLGRSACELAELGPFSVHTVAGEALEHDLRIALAVAEISGRVSDTRGAPVAGLLVEAQDPGRCWRQRALADEQGRYALSVPAGLRLFEVAVARAPERLSRLVAPGSEGVDFVLSELGRLRFRVLDASERAPVRAGKLLWRAMGRPYQELARLDQAIPEPGGWLTVDCIAGQIELAVVTARESHAPLVGHSVVVHPGATSVAELVMRPSLSLRVILDQASIAPPAGLACVVVPESVWPEIDYVPEPRPEWIGLSKFGPHDELEFNASGKAIARGLPPGNYRFKVWPESVRIEPERLHLSADDPETTVRASLVWR